MILFVAGNPSVVAALVSGQPAEDRFLLWHLNSPPALIVHEELHAAASTV